MTDLVSGILFLAPGFLALKLFYLLGAQRPRSEWEWTTWSVVASLPINGLASLIRDGFAVDEVLLRVLFAVAAGCLAASSWQAIRASSHDRARRLRTWFGASAWDEALEDANRAKRVVELVLDDGVSYRGTVGYGDRNDNEAEGWLYLIHPEVFDKTLDKYRRANGTHGYLVHRDRIKRLRILNEVVEPSFEETAQE